MANFSASELWTSYDRIETGLPSKYGMKESTPDSSWLQAKKIQNFHEDRRKLLSSERVKTKGSLSVGEWDPDLQKVELSHVVGNVMGTMGEEFDGHRYLYPEEALFLLDKGGLDLHYGGVGLSVEEAYSSLLGADTSPDHYLVYSHLVRMGYIIRRHVRHKVKKVGEKMHVDEENSSKRKTHHSAGPDKFNCVEDSSSDKRRKLEYEAEKDQSPEVSAATTAARKLNISLGKNESKKVPYSNWDFSILNFPNAADASDGDTIRVTKPSSDLLPSNIELTLDEYEVDVSRVSKTPKQYANLCAKSRRKQGKSEHSEAKSSKNTDAAEEEQNLASFAEAENISTIRTSSQTELSLKSMSETSSQGGNQSRTESSDSQHVLMSITSCPIYTSDVIQEEDSSETEPKIPARNWGEYKEFKKRQQASQDQYLSSAGAHLWHGEVTPLVKPQDATNTHAILNRLSIVQEFDSEEDESNHSRKTDRKPVEITYDLFQPNSKFKKSTATEPNYYVCIVSHDNPPPDLHELMKVREASGRVAPVLWAVVANGDINFYCFYDINMPRIVT